MLSQVKTCLACPNFQREPGKGSFCKANGTAIDFYNPAYSCPVGPWVAEKVWRYGDPDQPTPNPPNNAPPLSAAEIARRVKAEHAKSFWQKAASFLEVTTSGLASDTDIATRRASCAACPVKKTNPRGEEYCGACGCGENRWSILDKKLTYRLLPCPLERPGFYEAS